MNKQKLRAIYDEFKIPPSLANIRVEGAIPTSASIKAGFLKAGLTAADLTPIDWRKKIQISPVKNQQACGDCWAMSSTSALCDRFIAQKGLDGLILEHALTAQCVMAGPHNSVDEGCQGGQPFLAGQFFENYGCPSSEGDCPSWEKLCGSGCETLPSCESLKKACGKSTIYKAKKGSTRNLAASNDNGFDVNTTIANIKKELLNGPVVACYFVQVDFMASIFYKWENTNGVYINGAYGDVLDKTAPDKFKSRFNNPVGNQWGDMNAGAHAVEVVGWDTVDTNNPKYGKVGYWIVKNSWGPDWMDGGYFKIAMSDMGLNKNIAFDVPIGRDGQQFGGCVAWDPDLSTGADNKDFNPPKPNPSPPGPGHDEAKQHHKNTTKIILLMVVIILILCGIYLWWHSRKGKSPMYSMPMSSM